MAEEKTRAELLLRLAELEAENSRLRHKASRPSGGIFLGRYQDLLENANDAIFFTDTDGNYIDCNQKALELLGYEREELLAMSVFDLIPIEQGSRSRQEFEKLQQEGSYERFVGRIRTKAGDWRDIEVNSSGLCDGTKIIGSMDIVRDITDVLRIRQELKQARDAAQAASRAKSEFLANLSHEVRTPLNGINGILPLLRKEIATGRGHEYLDLLQFSSDRLTTLIKDIFEFARLENNKLTLDPSPFALESMIRHTVELIRPKAQAKKLTLNLERDEDLPVLVAGDHGRLGQILTNLVDNAVKFTDHGGIVVRVRQQAATSRQVQLLFAVSDTGIGIPKDKRDQIFNAFVQVDGSSTRRHGGLGLGLAIASELCRLMGGHLWLEDNPKAGTTFFFSLWLDKAPAKEAKEAPRQTRPAAIPRPVAQILPERQAQADGRASGKRAHHVLLAEDDEINRMLAAEMLLAMGLKVTCVNDGAQAVRAVRNNLRFDAILMDLQMPHMDGLTATSEIRKIEPQGRPRTPIIAITAHSLDGDRHNCLTAGMDDYMAKPFCGSQLRQIIRRFIPDLARPTSIRPEREAAAD